MLKKEVEKIKDQDIAFWLWSWIPRYVHGYARPDLVSRGRVLDMDATEERTYGGARHGIRIQPLKRNGQKDGKPVLKTARFVIGPWSQFMKDRREHVALERERAENDKRIEKERAKMTARVRRALRDAGFRIVRESFNASAPDQVYVEDDGEVELSPLNVLYMTGNLTEADIQQEEE